MNCERRFSMNVYIKRFLENYFVFLGFLVLWELLYLFQVVHSLILPSPHAVFVKFLLFFAEEEFFYNFLATTLRVLVSFILATLLGVSFGLIFGFYTTLDRFTEKSIDFFRSIPGIVLFPLFILFLGVSDFSRIAVAITASGVIILINTKYGLINSSKMRKHFYHLYKLKKSTLLFKVLLPEACPYIFTGLRIAISVTLIVVIVTEMLLGTNYGLGQMLVNSQLQFETDTMYAVIILLGITGSGITFLFNSIEKKIFHWREEK